MSVRRILLLVALASILLAACTRNTTLTFKNETDCGLATILVTNTETGNGEEYTLDEGDDLEIEIESGVEYRYNVNYAGPEGTELECESKSGSVLVPRNGQNSTFRLVAVTQTPTPEAAQ